jgi:glutamine amidotransferase
LFEGIKDSAFFYFVHSYYCEPADTDVIAGETDYGGGYASVVAHENLFGVQFHPEKSQKDGLRMLANFARV